MLTALASGISAITAHPLLAASLATPSGLLLMVTGGVLLRRRSLELQSLNPGARLIKTEAELTVNPPNYQYTRQFSIKALQEGLDHYSFKFNWTGGGPMVPTPLNPRHTVRIGQDPTGTGSLCRIDFDPLKKGAALECGASIELEDAAGTARPFFAAVITVPHKSLTLRAIIKDPKHPGNCRRRILPSESSLIPVREDQIALPRDGILEWHIANPRLRHRYQLLW